MNSLPATVAPTFTISWAGTDDAGGSGVASYDLYGSIDGGPLQPLVGATTATSIVIKGEAGHIYGFAVVATDAVGHPQATPTTPQVTTTTVAPVVIVPSLTAAIAPASPIGAGGTFSTSGTYALNVQGSVAGNVDYGDGSGTAPLALGGDGTFKLSHVYAKAGTFHVVVSLTGPSGTMAHATLLETVFTPPTPLVSGFGAGPDAFVITIYRQLLGRLVTLPELVSGARGLKKQASYLKLAKSLTRTKEYKLEQKHHTGTGISLNRAYKNAIKARDAAAPPKTH